jgi:hypothetical protein
MTAQVREILFYNGEKYFLSTEPLNPLLEIFGDDNPFPKPKIFSTACWRGYVGTWEILEEKLFLVGLKGFPEENKELSLENIFPNQKKVFAEWFSGEIQIPQGKMLHYEHMGYMSIFEKDLFFEFNKGNLVGKREFDNTKNFDPDDPMGWGKLAKALYEQRLKDSKNGKSTK